MHVAVACILFCLSKAAASLDLWSSCIVEENCGHYHEVSNFLDSQSGSLPGHLLHSEVSLSLGKLRILLRACALISVHAWGMQDSQLKIYANTSLENPLTCLEDWQRSVFVYGGVLYMWVDMHVHLHAWWCMSFVLVGLNNIFASLGLLHIIYLHRHDRILSVFKKCKQISNKLYSTSRTFDCGHVFLWYMHVLFLSYCCLCICLSR